MKQLMYVVDEDILFCNRIASLFDSTSFAVKIFECAEDFLKQSHPIAPGCFLIINSAVENMNIIELIKELKQAVFKIHIIVIGEEDNIPQAVKTMRAGAVDFIGKPFSDQKLKSCIEKLMLSET